MERSITRFLVALGALILCAPAVGAQTASSADAPDARSAVERLFQTYAAGVDSLDADLWLRTWDDNGIKMLPNARPIVGKSAIGAFIKTKFPLYASRDMRITIEHFDVSGELAIAQGSYTSDDRLKAGGGGLSLGWFTTVFKRQPDGSWKIYRDSIGPSAAPN